MSQFFNDHEIQSPGTVVNQLWPWKNLKEKKLRIFKKMLFSWEGHLKRWQTSTNSENYNFYMFALLEIARIYKALKSFAELQGPICYNDAQNKVMNLLIY